MLIRLAMISREKHLLRIERLLEQFPIVVILGARQIGKTTIARKLTEHRTGSAHWFDLEDPTDRARLSEPMLTLQELSGLVVLDEIQQAGELFPILRVLVDKRKQHPGQFLLLGSASLTLRQQSSESLAGRIAYYELSGFSFDELKPGESTQHQLWLRGGFPRSYLAESDEQSATWREQFIRTFLERDLPQLGIRVGAGTLRRFWMMLAHYHGNIWNASDFARSFGVSPQTINHYLDILTSTFVVRRLQPWHENIGTRQIKAPKIYLTDSGLLHQLLGQTTCEKLEGHPKVGASWEGFALEQLIRIKQIPSEHAFFWATHGGAELDLLTARGDERLGFEFKRTLTPQKTRSMHMALHTLKLDRLDVIYPGEKAFPLDKKIRAIPLRDLIA